MLHIFHQRRNLRLSDSNGTRSVVHNTYMQNFLNDRQDTIDMINCQESVASRQNYLWCPDSTVMEIANCYVEWTKYIDQKSFHHFQNSQRPIPNEALAPPVHTTLFGDLIVLHHPLLPMSLVSRTRLEAWSLMSCNVLNTSWDWYSCPSHSSYRRRRKYVIDNPTDWLRETVLAAAKESPWLTNSLSSVLACPPALGNLVSRRSCQWYRSNVSYNAVRIYPMSLLGSAFRSENSRPDPKVFHKHSHQHHASDSGILASAYCYSYVSPTLMFGGINVSIMSLICLSLEYSALQKTPSPLLSQFEQSASRL